MSVDETPVAPLDAKAFADAILSSAKGDKQRRADAESKKYGSWLVRGTHGVEVRHVGDNRAMRRQGNAKARADHRETPPNRPYVKAKHGAPKDA